MHVKKLIADNPSWLSYLMNELKIVVSRDEKHPHLVGLKYHMHESPMDNPIVRECRGMVVNIETNRVLAHPYNKFFNLGEPGADEIDWATARVREKLDGTMIVMYWDGIGWNVATLGSPTAGGPYGDNPRSFRDVFWQTFESLGLQLPPTELRDVTWMLELCAPDNRIVVKYDRPRIALHGARDLQTGLELNDGLLALYAQLFNWELVRSFPITTEADCRNAAAELDPLATEGFVVVDSAFRRIKVKSPRYVELHLMKGEMTPRRAIALWQNGEAPELLAIFPELASAILPIHAHLERCAEVIADSTLQALDQALELESDPVVQIVDRKAFAEQVKRLPWAAGCFKLYGEIVAIRAELGIPCSRDALVRSAAEHLRGMTVEALKRLLDVELPPPAAEAPSKPKTILGISADAVAAAVIVGETAMAQAGAVEAFEEIDEAHPHRFDVELPSPPVEPAEAQSDPLPDEVMIEIPAGFRVPDTGTLGDSVAAAAVMAVELANREQAADSEGATPPKQPA